MVLVMIAFISLASDVLAGEGPAGGATASEANDPMLALLRARAEREPDHSDSWRLIGKLEAKHGNVLGAMQSLTHALTIDAENAAAHFDLGQLLQGIGDVAEAGEHFQKCVTLAPKSEYAEQLYASGFVTRPANITESPPPTSPSPNASTPASFAVASGSSSATVPTPVQPVGYRIQTFDGSDDLEQQFERLRADADPTLKRWRVFVETGILYNSNVSLTPISRELANAQAESLQGLLNPELEWIALHGEVWRVGPLARGFFTVNESNQSAFNLASFQPGAYLERDFQVGDSEWIARCDYVYALDLLDGDRVGDRHSVTASVIAIRPDLDVIYTYITTSFSEFDDDGLDPSVSSLDGPAINAGISRMFQTDISWAPSYSLGVDLASADTRGTDFRYRSVSGHGDATFQLRPKWQLIPSVGVGHRDYYAFTGPVNRDEITWRVQGKLSWQFSQHTAVALVASHDRFASDNEDFDAERTEGGLIVTVTY